MYLVGKVGEEEEEERKRRKIRPGVGDCKVRFVC